MSYIVNDGTILTKGKNVRIGFGTVIGSFPLMFEEGTHDLIYGTKRVVIQDDVIIGNRVSIMGGFYRDTIIREGAKIWDGCEVGHDCDIGKQATLSTEVVLNGEVVVGDWSFLSSGVIVKPKVKIGKFVHIGLGAIVLGDVPDSAVIVGNSEPPKVIRVNEWRPKNGIE